MTLSSPLLYAIAAYVVTAGLARICRQFGIVQHPSADRWHLSATPQVGGIAIYSCIALWYLAAETPVPLPLFLSITALFVIGLIDDLVRLRPLIKSVLILTAIAVSTYLLQTEHTTIEYLFRCLFLFFICNSFNIFDNMDGVAASTGLLAFLFYALILPHPLPLILSAILCGFYPNNLPKANIFMGDCGSLVIGYCLGICFLEVLSCSLPVSQNLSMAAPLALIITDSFFVSITRIGRGQPISQGGKDHVTHRLASIFKSNHIVLLIIILIQVYTVLAGMLYNKAAIDNLLVLVALYLPVPVLIYYIYSSTSAQ